jgi:beta-1,4-mannosyltransferase
MQECFWIGIISKNNAEELIMKIIGFYPASSEDSRYFAAMAEALKMIDFEVIDYREALRTKEARFINFNFLENIIARNKFEAYVKYYKRCMLLLLCKLFRKDVIFTMHNRIPHDSAYERLSKRIMIKQIKQAKMIHIFSEKSKEILAEYSNGIKIDQKCYYIPHPNYLNDYNTEILIDREKYALKNEMIVLFFGQVRKYKNVELLIDIANRMKNEQIVFLIAGRPESDEYAKELCSRIEDGAKVKTEFRFLPDKEIAAWIKISDIVVFPYNKRSSLTSGTVFLAASKGKSVICPNIGTMDQMRDKEAFFIYDYESDNEHEAELEKAIVKAYRFFLNSSDAFRILGVRAEDEVRSNNSVELIAECYRNMLQRI